MKTKVKALTSFVHGRVQAYQGDEVEVTKAEAEELTKAGMVQAAGEDGGNDTTAATPTAAEDRRTVPDEDLPPEPAPLSIDDANTPDDVDDLLGDGTKMNDAPQNKMEDAPENKAGGRKPKAK